MNQLQSIKLDVLVEHRVRNEDEKLNVRPEAGFRSPEPSAG